MDRPLGDPESIATTALTARPRAVARLEAYLRQGGLPRLQMTVIVVATGLAGFGASAVLLGLGVSSMAIRYPLAVGGAYGVFLVLVRLWVEHQRHGLEPDLELVVDLAGELGSAAPRASDAASEVGEGGEFGGGGAGGSWQDGPTLGAAEQPVAGVSGAAEVEVPSSPGLSSAADALDVDLGDAWVIVVPIVLLGAGLLAAATVIYAAPALLAEVLLDVLLVSGLYRRLRRLRRLRRVRHLEPRSWLDTAVRRTWIPVAAVALLVAAGGFVLQRVVPGADSIGDVMRAVAG